MITNLQKALSLLQNHSESLCFTVPSEVILHCLPQRARRDTESLPYCLSSSLSMSGSKFDELPWY